jgi:amino-acid N-acetyltransferase
MATNTHSVNLLFRQAGTSDRETIRGLLSAAGLHTESIDGGPTHFVLASTGGRIAGVAGLEFYGPDALLRSVVISADLRNQGIGAILVDGMIARARERGIRRLFLLTNTAEKFFRRRGFVVTDRSATGNAALEGSTEFSSLSCSTAVCMMLALT